MAQPINTENVFEFSMTQSPTQSPPQTPGKNLSPKRSKITVTEEHLLAIHNKIRLHLTKEKPMNKFEMRKICAVLKRMKCQSPRVKKIAKSAKNILVECIHSYSQSSEKEGKKFTPRKSKLSLNTLTTPHSQRSKTYNESDIKIPISDNMELDNNSLEHKNTNDIGMFKNNLNNTKATLKQRGFTQSASNIFPHQTPNFTETTSMTKEVEKDRMLSNNDNLPFTVPTLLDKNSHYYSSAFQGSNVIKLKLGDVCIDSDSVSIPLELLTNLNFEDSKRSFSRSSQSNPFVKTIVNESTDSQHTDLQTVPSNVTKDYNTVNTIDIPSSPCNRSNNCCHHFNDSSNNIEETHTQYNRPPTNAASCSNPTINIISDVTVGTQKELLPISQLTAQNSELNIEVDNSSNKQITLHSNEITPFTPPKDSSDVIVISIDSTNSEVVSDYMFGNNVKFDLNSETPHNNCFTQVKNVDISTSFANQKEVLKVSDNEKRYLDTIADNDNTHDIFCETNIDEALEDNKSFVFDLGTESADFIEATPFDMERKKVFHHKIQTQFHKNQDIQGVNSNHKITNKPQVNTIDETPSNDTSETPELSAALESSSPSGEVPYSDQNPVNKKRKLTQCFETQIQSKSLLGPCEGVYYNPPEIKISETSKMALVENSNIGHTGVVQSQSLSDFSMKDLENVPSPSNFQEMESTNIIVIDGSIQRNTEPMTISQEEDESFEEKDRKLYEQIIQKRNKYKEKWGKKPTSEKFTYKYVNKFGINILEDPPELLQDLNSNVPVNNFHFSRFTLKEIAEKQKEWFYYQNVLDECAEKMVANQISLNNHEHYQLANDHFDSQDSDSSDEEQIVRKKLLKEISVLPMMNFQKSMKNCSEEKNDQNKENRLENILMENIEQDVEEEISNLNKNEEKDSLENMLRLKDLNWLK